MRVLVEIPSPRRNEKRRKSLPNKGKQNLLDFEKKVLGNHHDSCESDSLSEAELIDVPHRTSEDLIKFHESAVAQFDFKGRSDGE